MLDGGVPVSKVTEVMDVTGREQSAGSEGMNRGVTPLNRLWSAFGVSSLLHPRSTHSFIPESTTAVHHVEEVLVRLAAEPIQARNFKVTPEMAHIVALAFHSLRVDVVEVLVTGFGQENLVGKLLLLLLLGLGWGLLLRGALQEHLPQALGLEVVLALVCRRVAENVGNGLAKLLDCDGKAVGLVRLGHLDKWITDIQVNNRVAGRQMVNGE